MHRLSSEEGASADQVLLGYIAAAEAMLSEDVATNVAIGNFGATKILEMRPKEAIRVLTICNTGSLATAGYGTALGVVRSLHTLGRLEHVYACETRPYNQGARLTAFEIVQDRLPGTLITDSMAAYLMATRGVDAVVVGADRVAANGDTANKVGTYQLAIAAQFHGIPFFVAAPTTTLDPSTPDGSSIHIEERPESELTMIFGQRIAPEGIKAWNPAFDVTPARLITGIITERGVIERTTTTIEGKEVVHFDVQGFLRAGNATNGSHGSNGVEKSDCIVPPGFHSLDEKALKPYIMGNARLRELLNISDGAAADVLSIREVGDGNINFVYIVTYADRTVVIKQALPYIRCVGEGWPLTLERSKFEMRALTAHGSLCPDLVPRVLHFEESLALLVVEYIPPPHIILRKALIAKSRIRCYKDVARYMAHTLAGTSALALDGPAFRGAVSEWSRNTSMCAVTEQVIFSDPYIAAPLNRHNAPFLDAIVRCIRSDHELIHAAARLKGKFLGLTQALLHGDLHTGSIMVTVDSTFIIDPEFAFYGPMGFDLGAFLSNLLLNYFSQEPANGYNCSGEAEESEYALWLKERMQEWHGCFESEFTSRYYELSSGKGEFFTGGVGSTPINLAVGLKDLLRGIWWDTLGFAGMKMIRRIVGVAHVADLEEIQDTHARSTCEKKALLLARILVLASQRNDPDCGVSDIHQLLGLATRVYKLPPELFEEMADWQLSWRVLY